VDLQASKKSKGLQEQQSYLHHFNTLGLYRLTISTPEFALPEPNYSMNMRLRRRRAAQENHRDRSESGSKIAGIARQTAASLGKQRGEESGQFTGEKIQSKGRIRRSLAFDTFPCQPHRGLSQTISSLAKIFIASFSESAGLEIFRCKLILCPPLGHANTIL
jgi:hypothetical protein